jgi:hypothetical protein
MSLLQEKKETIHGSVPLAVQISIRNTLGFLSVVTGILTLLSVAGQFVIFFVERSKTVLSVDRMIDLNFECNLPSWYSSILLFLCALLLAAAAQRENRAGSPWIWNWRVLSGIFVFLSLDETAQLHEKTIKPMRAALGTSGVFYFGWVIIGIVFVLAVGLYSLKFVFALEPKTRFLFILAGFIYVGGSLGMEMLDGAYASRYGMDFLYFVLTDLEELMEMVGLLIFIHALLRFLRYHPTSEPTAQRS